MLFAQPFESWHNSDFALRRRSKQFTLHTQLRSADRFQRLYHARVGPLFQMPYNRLIFGGGYYYQTNRVPGRDLEDSHRPFGWVEFPLRDGRQRVVSRAMFERFLGAARPSFNRYRYQIRYTRQASWSPVISFESFLDHQGVFAWRYSGAMRRVLSQASELDVGYFYDQRRANVGGPRHVFFTNLRLRWGE
ncbi:MAG: DUF2490 domain-containing protein [Bryobacteraceae bacterium]|nr:DUF2490 domain-containing protein [Bryobacteraceae bacterium]MDW8379726.1 hypothetical protein [Bryobacterales bacterium]